MKSVKSRRTRLVPLLSLCLLAGGIHAAEAIEISSSFNPVGSGARATGMGGAFISVADDATAASWNPAGLVQLERPEVSLVYSYFNRDQSYDSSTHPEVRSNDSSVDAHAINYASVAYPFQLLDRNMIVSVNYQRLYDLNKKVQGFNFNQTDEFGDTVSQTFDSRQKGYLSTISPAIAVQVTPTLYFGATVNIWDDVLDGSSWETNSVTRASASVGGVPIDAVQTVREKNTLSGVNANLGLLWRATGNITVGAVYKTPFTADVDHEQTDETTGTFPSPATTTKEERTIKMPASYGIGISCRHSDAWTTALDVYYTDWSRFSMNSPSRGRLNPVSQTLLSEGRAKDTTQVRLGTEYLFINKNRSVVPLRFGVFYDPEPGRTRVDDYYGFSAGTGYSLGPVSADVSYQFRGGWNVTGDMPVPEVSSDIIQHNVMASVIYRF